MKITDAIYVLNQIPTGNMNPKLIKKAARKILNIDLTSMISKETLLNTIRWLIDELEGLHK